MLIGRPCLTSASILRTSVLSTGFTPGLSKKGASSSSSNEELMPKRADPLVVGEDQGESLAVLSQVSPNTGPQLQLGLIGVDPET